MTQPDAEEPGEAYTSGEVVLGKYRLERVLSVGGMGAVWKARNQLLDIDVAVKIMFRSGGCAHTATALRRAHSEARLAAQLRHPAVCSALDFGVSAQGDPVVVSPLLEGESLEALLRARGRLTPTQAAQLLLPVLDGLAAAHHKGIVHRDVKPSNVFLARGEAGQLQPMLLDFGIARSLFEKNRLTVAGSVFGTPDYMSPEQARGSSDVDLRSDLWSVCATLYELVSGRVPFDADNYNAAMFAVLNRAPSPLPALYEHDRELSAIITQGLEKDRAKRFQSAAELSYQLAGYLLSRGVQIDACGHSLTSRSRSCAVTAELPEASSPSTPTHALQIAPTQRRFSKLPARPRFSSRRGGLMAGVALWLGLGAWTSQQAQPQPRSEVVTARPDEPSGASPAAFAQGFLTAPPPAVHRVPTEAPVAPASISARAPAPPRPLPAKAPAAEASRRPAASSEAAPTKAPARAATTVKSKTDNALGYDFGL